ncbi:hypothetical protein SHIRM173S_13017 [Streptomyces hirsutus]
MLPSWEPLWPYRAVLAVDARNFSALDSKGMQQVNADILPLLSEALSASNVSAQWQAAGVRPACRRQLRRRHGPGGVARAGGLLPRCQEAGSGSSTRK